MKIRVPFSFVLFVAIVLLVGLFPIIRVPCPTCNGTGFLGPVHGLKAEITSSHLDEFKYFDAQCSGVWGVFTYSANILLTNETANPVHGYIVVAFYAPDELSPSLKIPVYVEVPAETTENVEKRLVYNGFVGDVGYDPYTKYPEPHKLVVELAEQMACPYCKGEGSLPLTEWLRLVIK